MPSQQENREKQEKAFQDERYEVEKLLRPVKLQNEYNKQNLETQHKYNLEIFEKQASLTREIQKGQAKLLKKLSWRTVIATILAVIIGALFGLYLERSGLKQSSQQTPKTIITNTEIQNTSALPFPGETETNKATKSSAQEESSSKSSLKKP